MFNSRDVNYLRFSQKFRYPSKRILGFKVKKGFFYGIINFFISFLFSIFKNPVCWKSLVKKSKANVIFYNGANQYNALIGVYNSLIARGEDVVLIRWADLPMWKTYLYSFLHLGNFCLDYYNSSKDDRKIIANELATYWRSYGDYDLMIKWFKKTSIKRLFLANDHIPIMRACLQACNDVNITTVYIQHASVTDKFPPLIATYSFLDGQDSLEKYTRHNESLSKVYLVGGARFDLANKISSTTNSNALNVIGIALTLRDDRCCWESLVLSIQNVYPGFKIILRPHPRMDLEPIARFCNLKGILYSDPHKENSFSFLKQIGFLIANETSTHLDAIIMHRPTVLYVGLSNLGLRDHYGMVKSGLLRTCSNFEELKSFIRTPKLLTPNVDTVRYYNASYLTKFEFEISKLIVSVVVDSNEYGLVDLSGNKYINYESE